MGRKDRGPMPSLLPRSDCTALNEPALNAISVACTAVVIDSRAQVLKWGRKDVMDALKLATPAAQPPLTQQPVAAAPGRKSPAPTAAAKAASSTLSPAASKPSLSSSSNSARKAVSFADRPRSQTIPRFQLWQLPKFSPTMPYEVLREPLLFTLSHALIDTAQKQISLLSFTADSSSEQTAWLRCGRAGDTVSTRRPTTFHAAPHRIVPRLRLHIQRAGRARAVHSQNRHDPSAVDESARHGYFAAQRVARAAGEGCAVVVALQAAAVHGRQQSAGGGGLGPV